MAQKVALFFAPPPLSSTVCEWKRSTADQHKVTKRHIIRMSNTQHIPNAHSVSWHQSNRTAQLTLPLTLYFAPNIILCP
jgi:hypothetical protein